eukprot:6203742-Pleurochrysis_carterae.AAC.3
MPLPYFASAILAACPAQMCTWAGSCAVCAYFAGLRTCRNLLVLASCEHCTQECRNADFHPASTLPKLQAISAHKPSSSGRLSLALHAAAAVAVDCSHRGQHSSVAGACNRFYSRTPEAYILNKRGVCTLPYLTAGGTQEGAV